MTPNQLVLLLDCHRGFDAARHLGTLAADTEVLRRCGVIDEDMSVTTAGQRVVEALCKTGDSSIASKRTRAAILKRQLEYVRWNASRDEEKLVKELDQVELAIREEERAQGHESAPKLRQGRESVRRRK